MKKNDGIALIIVLGMLSILVLMAVSFATLMRTERQAGSNMAEITAARLYTLSALDNTVFELSGDGHPWGSMIFPDSDWSTNQDPAVTSGVMAVDMILQDEHFGGGYFDGNIIPADDCFEWSEMLLQTNQNIKTGALYGYFVINESGRIDVNRFNTNLAIPDYAEVARVRGDRIYIFSPAALIGNLTNDYNNFTTYNRFTQKYTDNTSAAPTEYITNRIWLGGTDADLKTNRSQIVNMLAADNVSDPSFVFDCLLDYSDSNFVSEAYGAAGYCTDFEPMINEIVIETSVVSSNVTNHTIACDFMVEIWNPFDKPMSNSYSLISSQDPVINNSLGLTFSGSFSGFIGTLQAGEFSVLTNRYSVSYASATAPAGTISFADIQMTLEEGGRSVDDVEVLSSSSLNLPAAGSSTNVSFQINDPRMNYVTSNWVERLPPTLGTNNPGQEQKSLHIANAPLSQVGELAFLPQDQTTPWSFVQVTSSNKFVLDHFTVYTNEYQRGLVNLNTKNLDVLAAGLSNRYAEFSYEVDCTDIAEQLITKSSTTPFVRRSDATSVITNKRIWAACSDLLDVYGNTFTVLLGVKTFRDNREENDDNGRVVLKAIPNGIYDGPDIDPEIARQFLVAQFWRDPISKETKLTFLKWQRRK